MTSIIYDLQDATAQLRDWLRVVESPITSGTVFTNTGIYAGGVPATYNYDDGPAIALFRVGGGYDPPLDTGLYQFDVWGRTRPLADAASNALLSVLTSEVFYGQDMGNHFRYRGTTHSSITVNWVPDPDPNLFHRVVTAQVVTHHHADS